MVSLPPSHYSLISLQIYFTLTRITTLNFTHTAHVLKLTRDSSSLESHEQPQSRVPISTPLPEFLIGRDSGHEGLRSPALSPKENDNAWVVYAEPMDLYTNYSANPYSSGGQSIFIDLSNDPFAFLRSKEFVAGTCPPGVNKMEDLRGSRSENTVLAIQRTKASDSVLNVEALFLIPNESLSGNSVSYGRLNFSFDSTGTLVIKDPLEASGSYVVVNNTRNPSKAVLRRSWDSLFFPDMTESGKTNSTKDHDDKFWVLLVCGVPAVEGTTPSESTYKAAVMFLQHQWEEGSIHTHTHVCGDKCFNFSGQASLTITKVPAVEEKSAPENTTGTSSV